MLKRAFSKLLKKIVRHFKFNTPFTRVTRILFMVNLLIKNKKNYRIINFFKIVK